MIQECPKCKNKRRVKDGIVRGRQRYKCKECGYRYTVEKREAKESTPQIRKIALQLYLEGLGFRSIGRVSGFSHVAVYKWIKSFGSKIVKLGEEQKEIEIVEIDEMHSYIGNKKNLAGYGLLLIDIEKGLSILALGEEMKRQVKSFGEK